MFLEKLLGEEAVERLIESIIQGELDIGILSRELKKELAK